jgi:prepilin-type N-terminal cleavage/methylation domain-containing protein
MVGMRKTTGFTIVELLIVIVVIAILASITVVAFNGVQDRARKSKISSDLGQLDRAIKGARANGSTALRYITGSAASGSGCWGKPDGTDLATLLPSDGCWTAYNNALATISTASGINVNNLKDPWGRPYYIDENEDEPAGTCRDDNYGVYAQPFTTGQTMTKTYATRGC